MNPTQEELLRQETEIRFDSFDFDAAWEIGQIIRQHALETTMRFPSKFTLLVKSFFWRHCPVPASTICPGCGVRGTPCCTKPIHQCM
jgi:hypothetical protein